MINVLRQNSSKFIQWTVQSSTSPFVSDAFPFQDRKCYLELTLGEYWQSSTYNPSYLNFKSNGILKPPVKIIVRAVIAFDTSTSQQLTTTTQEQFITSDYQRIWTYSAGRNLSLSLLTFDVIIYDGSSKVDKSIQTSSYIDKFRLLDDISHDFAKMLDEDVNHDVEFTCGDLTVKAHKNVLCCRSNIFASMLQADMVEGQTGRVNIVDMDAAFFQQLVKFLYTGILPELTLSNAVQFYNAGDKYNIGTLKKQCAGFFIDSLSPENACDILIVADRHSDVDFKKCIIEYMTAEKVPSVGDKWSDFCKDNPALATEVLNFFCQSLLSK